MAHADDQARTARAVRQKLESLQRAGVTHLPKRRAVASHPAQVPVEMPVAVPPVTPTAAPPAEDRAASLALVAQDVARCTRCAELARTRKQTVFGVGNPHARLVFLGEAPGADEDRLGEPFVGRAGKLLTDMIEKGMRLKRADVYICNILRCRPPENRTPLPEEAGNCRRWLDVQLAIIRPEFICCLGACAAQNLLNTAESIGRLRGRIHQYQGARVICTYHPAYLLRNPAAKRQTWEDLQMLMHEMGFSSEGQ